jgi:tetratricopeptide (TPR) repeat protein
VTSKKKRAASTPSQTRVAPKPQLSPGRKWLFRLILAIGMPLFLFGVLEIALRLMGYGYVTSFFIANPVPGQKTVVENRQFSRRYFPRELARIPRSLAFEPVHPPQTLRIFVFGESAAEGDPAPAFSFSRILQVLLRDQLRDQRIEVINTAVTAINSHVILPVARDAAAYGGDVWVIYMGNNEVVGPFGAGTVFGSHTPNLAMIHANLALKSWRTGQLLDNALHSSGGRAGRTWEGMEMFLGQQVRKDDPQMEAVYSNFRKNLSEMISIGTRAGAEVVVCTVGSNLRECAPFASLHAPHLSPAKLAEWDTFYQAGAALEKEGKWADAIARYESALKLDDSFAELRFRLGSCLVALGDTTNAAQQFILSRDLDTLRFRADTRINEIIRELSDQWRRQNVRLADVEKALASASPTGIAGSESFYEHVHLTFEGNCQVARELARQIVQGRVQGEPKFLSADECAERLGLTDCERMLMTDEVVRRISRPPFVQQLDHESRVAQLQELAAQLHSRDETNFSSSKVIYEKALSGANDDWLLHDHFAGALLQHGDWTNAVAHWKRVLELLPHRVETYDLLGSIAFDQRNLSEAQDNYQRALRIQPGFVDGRIGLGRVLLAQDRKAEAVREFERAVKLQPRVGRTHNQLGVALLELGKGADAEQEFRNALSAETNFIPAELNLSSALIAQGRTNEAMANYREVVAREPGDAAVRMAYGRALSKQGKLRDAAEQYAEAARLKPDNFDVCYTLASAFIRLNDLRAGAEYMQTAIRLRPDSSEAHLNYGSILARQGKPAEALVEFETSLRLKPDFSAAHFNMAMALMELDRSSEAIEHLREVLRFEPGNARAQSMLQTALARKGN